MKKIINKAILLAATLLVAPMAGAYSQTSDEVTSRVPAKIHVNQEFGDWNDVQIRLSGVFKNSCFSKEDTEFAIQGSQILIHNLVAHVSGQPCLQMLTPYRDAIEIRDLKKGSYDVLVLDRFGNYEEMTSFKTN